MELTLRKFLAIAVFVGIALFPRSEAKVTVTSNFDSYVTIIPKLTNMADRLTLFRSVWGEIRADDTHNLDKIKTYYDNLLIHTKDAMNAEAEEAAELIDEVRNVLVMENGNLLAETLNNNASLADVTLFRNNLLTKYSVELLYGIFEHAINIEYPFESTDVLHAALDVIDLRPSNLNVFKVRTHWNLYLYYKFLQLGDINDQYVYSAALAFRNLRFNTNFNGLTRETTRRIDAAFETLPPSMYSLFNSASVCLENVNINNYYLYLAESNTATVNRFVPAVIRSRFEATTDRLRWINSFADRNSLNPTELNLRTQSNSWLLYRQQNNSTMLIQQTDTNAALRNWKPLLRNNNILFEQTGFYMCSTPDFSGELIGFKVIATQNLSLDDTSCQWKITDCSRI